MAKLSAVVLLAGSLLVAPGLAQAQVTIFFEGSGAENGVTEAFTMSFSFMGSNWSGGVVRSEGLPPLYASGRYSYEVGDGGAMVTFDTPVDSVRFFYVHGFGFAAGTASAFDSAGSLVAMADSRPAGSFGNPGNFVSLESNGAPIARIEFSGGVIDNFTFSAAIASSPTPLPTSTPTPPSSTATPTAVATATLTSTPGAVTCVGDCDGDNAVTVNELVTGVNIALGRLPLDTCERFDRNSDGQVTIDELIAGVGAALKGCVAS
ncbi:MAG: hypothetical protein ACE5I7_00310 [Candidatus Binatia bacterium]